jgi:hypothetical protein
MAFEFLPLSVFAATILGMTTAEMVVREPWNANGFLLVGLIAVFTVIFFFSLIVATEALGKRHKGLMQEGSGYTYPGYHTTLCFMATAGILGAIATDYGVFGQKVSFAVPAYLGGALSVFYRTNFSKLTVGDRLFLRFGYPTLAIASLFLTDYVWMLRFA